MTDFNWLTMCHLIDVRKRKLLEKFSLSGNSLCQVIVNSTCMAIQQHIHHSFTLSLQAQNLPFQQILLTLNFFLPTGVPS